MLGRLENGYTQTLVRICDIVIYNAEYIFVFVPFYGTEFINHWNFLSDDSIKVCFAMLMR